MSLYYLDDYSLGEIAEEFNISRQAVYDNIKRTEAMLEEYEEKLLLLKKFQQRNELLNHLKTYTKKGKVVDDEFLRVIDALEKLE